MLCPRFARTCFPIFFISSFPQPGWLRHPLTLKVFGSEPAPLQHGQEGPQAPFFADCTPVYTEQSRERALQMARTILCASLEKETLGEGESQRERSAKEGKRQGKAELRLELTDIEINGRLQPIVTGDFRLAGKAQGTIRNTAIGAALGALIGGSDGAEKGALAGFGASLLIPGRQVEIQAGTLIEFRLHHSFTSEMA